MPLQPSVKRAVMVDSARSRFDPRASSAVAFLSSLVFHIALLLLLACWIYTAGRNSRGMLLTAHTSDTTATDLQLAQTFELQPPSSEPLVQSSQPELSVELSPQLIPPISQPDSGLSAALASLAVGDVSEQLAATTRGRGASFFGTYAEGNRFVYVLDSSRSMKGDRWTYACNKLIDSLNGLKPGQEFFVLCFDLDTSFLFNVPPQQAKFLEIDDYVVTRVRRWLRSRTLGQATMPADALRFALEFNPDAIFLLSDGELQDNSLVMLRLLNGLVSHSRQIPIHTIHLFSEEGRQTLQRIALENSGTFTPVRGR
ncbi:MAG: VWA domain-containing protein [Planctomycetales bacterium]|nr:VWA domain-containing protein [Planctomycetales bacterium]